MHTAREHGAWTAFLVGSPRSGTTAVASALGRHPSIAHFYEPYFLWERVAPSRDDDRLAREDLSPAATSFLRDEYARFAHKSGAALVLDKTPENAFRIPAIERVFPEARFVHLVRDGRDATLSIRREWQRRAEAVRAGSPLATLRLARAMLARQPFWRNRLQALSYELRSRLARGNLSLRNKAKWGGAIGWGPRFPGWREAWRDAPELAFHALQWRRSVEAVETALAGAAGERWITVHYEDLVAGPERELARIQDFLGVAREPGLGSGLRTASVGRWRAELGDDERRSLEVAIGDKLEQLGYERAC